MLDALTSTDTKYSGLKGESQKAAMQSGAHALDSLVPLAGRDENHQIVDLLSIRASNVRPALLPPAAPRAVRTALHVVQAAALSLARQTTLILISSPPHTLARIQQLSRRAMQL